MDYDVNGIWYSTVHRPDGNQVPVTYYLKVDGSTVTGTAESPAGSVSVDDGTYTDGVVKFKLTIDGNDYPHEFKATTDGKLVGSIDFGGQSVVVTAERSSAQPQTAPMPGAIL
jgi:hypothetical protein